jgi:hypothetical protein
MITYFEGYRRVSEYETRLGVHLALGRTGSWEQFRDLLGRVASEDRGFITHHEPSESAAPAKAGEL